MVRVGPFMSSYLVQPDNLCTRTKYPITQHSLVNNCNRINITITVYISRIIFVIVNITITTFIGQIITSSVRSILLSHTHSYSFTIEIHSSKVFAWSALLVTDCMLDKLLDWLSILTGLWTTSNESVVPIQMFSKFDKWGRITIITNYTQEF